MQYKTTVVYVRSKSLGELTVKVNEMLGNGYIKTGSLIVSQSLLYIQPLEKVERIFSVDDTVYELCHLIIKAAYAPGYVKMSQKSADNLNQEDISEYKAGQTYNTKFGTITLIIDEDMGDNVYVGTLLDQAMSYEYYHGNVIQSGLLS